MAYIETRLEALEAGQATILGALQSIEGKINRALGMALGDAQRDIVMAKSLERITKEVEEQGDVVQSAATLIEGLAQQIRDAAGDEDKLNQLADKLDAQQQQLAQAVAANTPHTPSGM
jgi:hypothetical protein